MRMLPCLLAIALLAPPPLAAWGREGHEIVAAIAFKDLPPELAPWFRGQEETLKDHCNDPDHWKWHDPLEGPRHFLDCEAYGGPDSVPGDLEAAKARLGAEAFARNGQVPWVIQDRVHSLAQAWGSGDPARVALEAAILCHYVGDLNVPLHTTGNYDGQLSGQKGVHRRWETGLVQRLGGWEPQGQAATLDPRALDAPWDWLRQSNALVAALLRDDEEAGAAEPAGSAPGAGESAYWREFGRRQGPSVRAQLERAGLRTAQMILLAWRLAGAPAAP